MQRNALVLVMLLSATVACMGTAPTTSAPRLPTAIVVTEGVAAPPRSTIAAIKPTPSQFPTARVESASQTEIPLRVEISTSSDWTNLEIVNSAMVHEARIVVTDGIFTNHTAAPELVAMNQTLANAEAGKTITLNVALLVDAAAAADELDMILQKGDIGLATLRFYRKSDAGDVLIQEISHDFPAGGPTGLNELAFSIPIK